MYTHNTHPHTNPYMHIAITYKHAQTCTNHTLKHTHSRHIYARTSTHARTSKRTTLTYTYMHARIYIPRLDFEPVLDAHTMEQVTAFGDVVTRHLQAYAALLRGICVW